MAYTKLTLVSDPTNRRCYIAFEMINPDSSSKSMRKLVGLILSICFLIIDSYAQEKSPHNQSLEIESLFQKAKTEFETFERKHGGSVQTPNVNLHYLEWGNPKNTPLIWVHGSFTNAYEMADMADQLVKNGYYLIAIDYYGHGQTKIPEHEVSLYHVADDIHALMASKNIPKAIIGGWSRGGIIATAFYDEYPEKVLGIILEDGGSVSTNTHYHQMTEEGLTNRVRDLFKDRISYPKFDSQFEAYQALYNKKRGGTQFKLLAWITQDSKGKWTIGPGIEELFHMSDEKQFLNTVLRPTQATLFGESMAIIQPKIVYRNLNVPMLILDPLSESDLFPYEKENQKLKDKYPELITYKRYPDTGHNIHYERPEAFINDLSLFLKTVESFWHKKP